MARPIYPGTYFGTAGSALIRAASLWDELEAAGVPGIKGVWKMPGGGSRFINVIAIEQMHAGHAKMAGLVAAGCGSSSYLGRILGIDRVDLRELVLPGKRPHRVNDDPAVGEVVRLAAFGV